MLKLHIKAPSVSRNFAQHVGVNQTYCGSKIFRKLCILEVCALDRLESLDWQRQVQGLSNRSQVTRVGSS